MNDKLLTGPAPSMTFGDILYVLFRHKWKIALISGAGLIGALSVPLVMPAPYQSEAKLFIKYVIEAKSPARPGASDSQIKSADERGENIINTELEILTSLDVAQQAALAVGPEKILAKNGGGTNAYVAAALIRKNLLLDVPKKSSVIHAVFQHPDPEIVQPVLKEILDIYLKNHQEAHRTAAVAYDVLTQETDQIRSQLAQTEEDLRNAKAKAGVVSLEDSKKIHSEEVAKIRESLFAAEADLAERQAAIAEMSKLVPATVNVGTNVIYSTNELAVSSQNSSEYRRLCGLLESLTKKEQDLLIAFKPSSSFVTQIREQITSTEKAKKQMEEENPSLLLIKMPESNQAISDPDKSARAELAAEKAKVNALQSKIKVLTGQLDELRKEASVMYEAEGTITDLQRKRELAESHYKYFSESLENSRIDERLGSGRIPNISRIQEPSPAFKVQTKIYKLMAAIFFGGVGLALSLAFVIELVLDQSLKRAIEVEQALGLPLFISIPEVSLNGIARGIGSGRKLSLLTDRTAEATHNKGKPSTHSTELTPWDPNHILRPFYEALRDRLIAYFEITNLLHKPKLVAITSCNEGSGVSTVAAGLAASLSETGDGNVLLVDMNQQNGAAHQFCNGELACGLDEALEAEKREQALVQENLYVVTESKNGDRLPTALPKRFKNLVPRLKASDYDYIIFDMPPVTQISVTPRLARFMDMVFMVVEPERTNRQMLKRATSMLAESKANIGVILNKSHDYMPKLLRQEL